MFQRFVNVYDQVSERNIPIHKFNRFIVRECIKLL